MNRPPRTTFEIYLSPVRVFLENLRESHEIALQSNRIASSFQRGYELIDSERIENIKSMEPNIRHRVLEDIFLEKRYLEFGIMCDKEMHLGNYEKNPVCIARAYELKFFEETIIPTYERHFGSLDRYRNRRAA